jgi:cobalt-precorrin 5A hydrolase
MRATVSAGEPVSLGQSRPRSKTLAVGIGCTRGTALQTLQRTVGEALEAIGAGRGDVAVVASIDRKANERGLVALLESEGWPARFFSAAALARVRVPERSARVQRLTGTPSVSAAAALLAAGGDAGVLIAQHRARDDAGCFVAVAIARIASD